MSKDKDTAIKSAESVAALRAAAANEACEELRCADYLAKNFLGTKYKLITSIRPQSLLKKVVNSIAPGSYGFAIIRTRHFDNALLREINEGIEQLVLLGAGYDTRGIRYAERLKGTEVYEVDFPGTQQYKRKRLARVVTDVPSNIHYLPLDFNEEPFEAALQKAGFSTGKKTLFLWEGVSYYLPEAVVRGVLNFVSRCAEGSSIVLDYATKAFVNGDHSTHGGKQVAEWLKKINEPFLFGLNANEVTGFISSCGLSVISDLGPEELEHMYLKTRDGKLIGKTLGHVRMVHAKVITTK